MHRRSRMTDSEGGSEDEMFLVLLGAESIDYAVEDICSGSESATKATKF